MTQAENFEILGRKSLKIAINMCISETYNKFGQLIEIEFADKSMLDLTKWESISEKEYI